MRKTFTVRKRKFHLSSFKIRDAYGISSGKSSKLKRGRTHLLLMDFETTNPINLNIVKWNLRGRFPRAKVTMYKTQNGFHAIIWKRFSFRKAAIELVKTPFIDLTWVGIGLKRGYWFLETPYLIFAPKNMRPHYLKIERAIRERKQEIA